MKTPQAQETVCKFLENQRKALPRKRSGGGELEEGATNSSCMQGGEAPIGVIVVVETNFDRVRHVLRSEYVFLAVVGNTSGFTNPSHRGSDLCLETLSLLGEPHFVCFVPVARDKDNLSFSPPR